MNLFYPKMYQKDIYSINYSKLKEKYKLLIFDLDNTIGSIKEDVCNQKTTDFLNNLMDDFIIVVASNSHRERVLKFTKNLKCDVFYLSLKPTLHVLRKIKKKYQIPYSKMVIIGDQIMTDIFVGNRKNLLTILVDKVRDIDFKITSINRIFERKINKINNLKKGDYYE